MNVQKCTRCGCSSCLENMVARTDDNIDICENCLGQYLNTVKELTGWYDASHKTIGEA